MNYPHNPTGATVDFYFYRELLKTLRFSNMLIVGDCAHMHPGNPDAAGPLQVKNAVHRVLELHSFAVSLGIPGLGFAVGNKNVISILKNLMIVHGFTHNAYNLHLALACLDHADEIYKIRMEELRKRRETLVEGLKRLNWHLRSGRLVPFVWAKPPFRSTSPAIARRLFIKAGIRVTPGSDFGENGEGWIRMALNGDERKISESIERLSQHSRLWQRKFRPDTQAI